MPTTTAEAQYFGQNKVQYEHFDFQVMKTEHLDIYYYPEERAAVEEAARMAERWIARLSIVLDHRLRGRQPLVLYASQTHFVQTNVISGIIGEGTGGVTEPLQRRVVLPLTGSLEETDHVLGHELVHAFQYDIGGRALQQLPLWFIEGMAEYLSIGPTDAQTAVWLRDSLIRDDLPDFDDLSDSKYFPYRFGHAAWAYLAGRWGDQIVPQVFRAASQNGNAVRTIEAITQIPLAQLSADWHRAIAATYRDVITASSTPAGGTTIVPVHDAGDINVGPALSPDGSRLVFFSQRGRLSIELYLADGRSGAVLRKLTEAATDPHLDSMQFLRSAGAWSPNGRQFAFATVAEGRAVLEIIEIDTGDTVREITLPEFDEVLHPAWSPNGQSIALAGMSRGVTDLYVYYLASGRVDRLTNDIYADLEPTWSPAGTELAFVTDRFSTNLERLETRGYRLALFDVSSRRINAVNAFDNASHIDPQFAPDGRTLFFVSSPTGVPNVFRLALGGARPPTPVTNVATGVIGITTSSPALSIAQKTGALAYTVYTDRGYAIRGLPNPARGSVTIATDHGAALPPVNGQPSRVAALEAEEQVGLPPSSATFETSPYDPDLSLNFVGASAGAVGLGAASPRLGGGVSMIFSDVLNRHMVGATVDSNGGFKDIGAQLAYLNHSHRWQWGALVRRAPFRSATGQAFVGDLDGRPAIVEQLDIFRQTDYDAQFFTQYAFNRAARVEFSAGGRFIGFDRERQLQAFDPATGQLIADATQDLPASESLTLGQASTALVYDTSIVGATGPVLGTRSRLELRPLVGDLTFSEVTADYRRYFAPVTPFTIAVRGLHIGRYGRDADSGQLAPLFLGYPTLVRGYDIGSFNARECVADANGACPAFDRLLGTRMLVGNVELRFPLAGAFTGRFDYGGLPIDGIIFGDTGVAWTADNQPSFATGTRDFVSSVGAGVRVNTFGYLSLEFDAVRPFDRPDNNWQFVFAIKQGF